MSIRVLSLMSVFAAYAFAQGTSATSTITREYNFPPVGLASSETAQVNVVNVATLPTAVGATAPSCSGTVTFANASGKTVSSPASFTTTGSQIFSTQLTFSELGATGVRSEFLASVQLTSAALPATASCSLVLSLETFDTSTGVTHVYLGNPTVGTSVLGFLPIFTRQ